MLVDKNTGSLYRKSSKVKNLFWLLETKIRRLGLDDIPEPPTSLVASLIIANIRLDNLRVEIAHAGSRSSTEVY